MNLRATPYNRASEGALRIYKAVLDGVRADKLIQDSVRRTDSILEIQDKKLDLASFEHVYVCGAGKASFGMASALAEILGPRLSGGLVITKHGHGGEIPGVKVLEASHPVPDESSLEAGRQMLDFAAKTGPSDLVLFCLSGGASALMESLKDDVTLHDLQDLNRRMLAEGKPIEQINRARSCLSKIKAGGLAEAFSSATVAVLVLSDVMNGGLETIGSGPFWGTDSEEWIPVGTGNYWQGAEDRPYEVVHFPGWAASIRAESRKLLPGGVGSPQQLPQASERVFHRFVGNWLTAVAFAKRSAGIYSFDEPFDYPPRGEHRLGPETIVAAVLDEVLDKQLHYRLPVRGDAREEAERIAKSALHLEPGHFRVFAGEPTVQIRGDGRGGRCQELATVAATLIQGHDDLAILAGSTDGTDGPTDVGGAIADGSSVARAKQKGITLEAALANSDSFRFLEACGGLIYTGPTQSNVNDIVIAIRV